jgi:hypothetical protein
MVTFRPRDRVCLWLALSWPSSTAPERARSRSPIPTADRWPRIRGSQLTVTEKGSVPVLQL